MHGRLRRGAGAFVLALVLVAALCGGAHARRNVLLVFDEDNDLPGLAVINRSVREALRSGLNDDVEFFSESLNLSQFRNPGHQDALREHFRRKYRDTRLELVVAVLEPSLEFLLGQGGALFANVPIVFCGTDASGLKDMPRGNVTGVVLERDFAPTLDIALRLQPDTRNVFVVGGASQFDAGLQDIARRNLKPFESRVQVNWLTALPMDALLKQLAELPPHSVIYYLTVFADGAGQSFVAHEVLRRVVSVANAPVYVAVDQFVGLGAVGGNVYSLATHGQQAAQIGLRILRGERASAIPVVALSAQSNLFDARQLQRWGLDERRLPAGSAVEFRTPSLWSAYGGYIVAGVTLFLLQSALVVALLINRAQRRRAELAGRNSERRRVRAEDEARRQRDELAHAQRLATLGELTGSFAHELNQPLTAIAANAQAARKLLAANRADPEVEEALEDVAKEASRAGDIIHGLRALFRKEAGVRTRLDVNDLIRDVLRLLGPDLRARDISVQTLPGRALPAILGDGTQLRQVLINLLVNAQEAIALAGDGPREVRIETDFADAGYVEIAIRDSGTGVEEAELGRMFERFVSSKPQGLGMGLAISRSIVEAHGGFVWATRNDGRGLTVHLRLPVHPAEPAPPPTANRAPADPSPRGSRG